MEVRHEPPSPDTLFRVSAPLLLGFPDNETLKITHWSLRAVYDARLQGRELSGTILSIPFQGVGVYFPVKLVPGDTPEEFCFDGLTGRQRETLALFYRNLLSGRMASTNDIISSLDTPVDLVPMTETPSERRAASAGMTPRPVRVISNLVIYGVLFLLVFGYLGTIVFDRLSIINVPAAHVASPVLSEADLTDADAAVVGATVLGHLAAEHALDVWEGMRATIRFNAGGQEHAVPGTVQSVMSDGEGADGGIWLIVTPDPATDANAMALPEPGAPVHVDLKRDMLRRAFGSGSQTDPS